MAGKRKGFLSCPITMWQKAPLLHPILKQPLNKMTFEPTWLYHNRATVSRQILLLWMQQYLDYTMKKVAFRWARSDLHRRLREMTNEWWTDLSQRIQLFAETEDFMRLWGQYTAHNPGQLHGICAQ